MANECLERVKAASGGKLDDREAARVLREAADTVKRLRRESLPGKTPPDLAAAVLDDLKGAATKAAQARNRAYQAALTFDREVRAKDALRAQGLTPTQTFAALVRGVYKQGVTGAANSLGEQLRAAHMLFAGALDAKLAERSDLVARIAEQNWTSPSEWLRWGSLRRMGAPSEAAMRLSDDVFRASVDPSKVEDEGARWLAQAIKENREGVRRRMNAAGAFVEPPAPGRDHLPVVEDQYRVGAADAGTWAADVRRLFDLDPAVAGKTDEEVGNYLAATYSAIVSGRREGVFGGTAASVGRDVFRRFEEQKAWSPRSADALVEYNRLYGRGTAFDSALAHARVAARAYGFATRLGRNPVAMLDRLVADEKAKIDADRSVPQDTREAWKQDLKSVASWPAWRALSGELDIPQGARIEWTSPLTGERQVLKAEELFGAYRSIQNIKKIAGGAFVSHVFTAPAAAVSNLRQNGTPFLRALSRHVEGMLSSYGPDQRRAAELAGVTVDTMANRLAAPFASLDSKLGALSRLGQLTHRLGLMEWYPEVTRVAMHTALAREMGMAADKGWDALEPRYRHGLAQHGITPAQWDALRSARVEVDGRPFLDPHRFSLVPDALIDPIVAEERARVRAAAQAKLDEIGDGPLLAADRERVLKREAQRVEQMREQARDGLELAYRRFVGHEIGRTIVDPSDPAVKGVVRGQRGSWTGEAWTSFWQAHGYAVGLARRTMASQWAGNVDRGSLAQNVIRNRFGNFGSYAATAAVAGILTVWLKQITQGETPTTFHKGDGSLDPGALFEAMAKGGALGIYMDYVAGQASSIDKGGWMESLGGPAVSDVGHYLELTTRAIGDWYKTTFEHKRPAKDAKARKLFDLVWGDTPIPNLFYTRKALDYLVLDQLREWLDPGFKARHERALRREKGQSSFLSPSPSY